MSVSSNIAMDGHPVRAKQVHDGDVVAIMLAHGVPQLVTENPTDFTRFTEILVGAVWPSKALGRPHPFARRTMARTSGSSRM